MGPFSSDPIIRSVPVNLRTAEMLSPMCILKQMVGNELMKEMNSHTFIKYIYEINYKKINV